tara:strand:+ start:508 stop:1530 length:1023 start_codon:yes stop_codon:yes gene_type:complete
MLAAVLVKSKSKLEIMDIELPELSFGQVLVKLKFSGICGAQINEIDAVKGRDKFLPHLLGHEGTGIVEEIGDGVKTVKKGDHVVLHWKKGNGIESNTPKYKYKGKIINAGWVTTFNEKAIVSENRVTKIDKKFNLKIATLMGCSLTTAYGVVNNDANIKIGQSVIIVGLGGVGLNLVQACSLVSANPIVGIDINQKKIELAYKYGLDYGIKYLNNNSLKKKINAILDGNKANIVIETTGISEMIELAYDLTSPDGKTILVGVPNKNINIYSLPLHFDKILKGSFGGNTKPEIDIPNYIKLILKKRINLKPLITHEFPLKKINDALKLFRTGNAGRIIIKF